MTEKKALFLDRDGVINVDYGYVYRPEHFVFIDGIFELCRDAKRAGYLLFVVTNQAGIARGFYTENDFHDLTGWMCGEFQRQRASIEKVYYCPYHPEHGVGHYKRESSCRKPRPGMIITAASEFDLSLPDSILIGDKKSDMDAGISAGVGCNILFSPFGDSNLTHGADHIVRSLVDAAAFFK